MRGVSILFRLTYATLLLCVLSFGTAFGQGGETFSYPRSGASGIWTEASALGSRYLELDENGRVVEYEEEADIESLASEPGFGIFSSLRIFGEARADASTHTLFRGQVVPPTESPTSSTTISSSASTSSSTPSSSAVTSNVSTPPVTSPSTTTGETTFQRVFQNSQDFSSSFLYMTASKNPEYGGKPTMRDMEIDARILFACPCGSSALNNGYFLVTPSFKYTNLVQYTALPKVNEQQSEEDEALYYLEQLAKRLGKEIVSDSTKTTKTTGTEVVKDSKSFYDFGISSNVKTALRDLEVDGEVTLGLASRFGSSLSCKSFYIRGRLVGELPVDSEKKSKIVGGAAYYGRVRYKVLPVLGLVLTPNPQNEFRLIYPNPRWSHFLTKVNGTDWWFYIRGDLGGGTWKDKTEQMDYNDYRIGLGVTFDCSSNLMGSAEIGGAFGRELRWRDNGVTEKETVKDAFYFKFGLLF